MSNDPTPQAPVSDVSILTTAHNPFGLTDDIRTSLISVFCDAFHYHKCDYLDRKKALAEHLAKEEYDKKHTPVLISLCNFSESRLNEIANTYKTLMGSEFWLEEFQKITAEANQTA